jgi:thioredoxin-dependent peroxiredoxin
MLDWFDWLFSDPLPAGSKAPDFTLPKQDGGAVRLSSLRGKNVVLVFYPGDDTPVCRKQLCEFRDQWAEARKRNTEVFGVNPASAGSHAKFQEKYHLPFPLLVDAGQKVAALYHASGIFIKRTVYLIGPDGAIRYAQRGKPDPREVLAAAR